MLLEIAIGDAYGAGFEYAPAELVRDHNNLSDYVTHPTHAIGKGRYTDDAQMSIGFAEVIVCAETITRELLADSFVRSFKRDERLGYAGGFYAFLKGVADGADFLARIKPASDKSGAAMRACPAGIFPSIEMVRSASIVQASLTHDTDDGRNAAIAAALATHYFLYDLGKKADLGAFLDANVPGEWSKPWSGKVGEKGWMSVRAALTAIANCDGMSAVLRQCVEYTGDVDTCAAIALGIASGSKEIKQDLPLVLIDGLENGAYGRDFLIALDQKLAAELTWWKEFKRRGDKPRS